MRRKFGGPLSVSRGHWTLNTNTNISSATPSLSFLGPIRTREYQTHKFSYRKAAQVLRPGINEKRDNPLGCPPVDSPLHIQDVMDGFNSIPRVLESPLANNVLLNIVSGAW